MKIADKGVHKHSLRSNEPDFPSCNTYIFVAVPHARTNTFWVGLTQWSHLNLLQGHVGWAFEPQCKASGASRPELELVDLISTLVGGSSLCMILSLRPHIHPSLNLGTRPAKGLDGCMNPSVGH